MVSSECSNEYWFVVEKCLVKFHHISLPAARKKIQSLQERLMEGKTLNDLIYHVEPFELACDIGKQDLCLDEYWSEYKVLLEGCIHGKATDALDKPKKKVAESNLLSMTDYSASRYRSGDGSLGKKASTKKTAGARKTQAKKAADRGKKKTTRK